MSKLRSVFVFVACLVFSSTFIAVPMRAPEVLSPFTVADARRAQIDRVNRQFNASILRICVIATLIEAERAAESVREDLQNPLHAHQTQELQDVLHAAECLRSTINSRLS